MTGIDAQLTREFFELNGFRVHTRWAHTQRGDTGVQLYVDNPEPADGELPELVLSTGDVQTLRRALVEVRPWHTERLYASVIENNAILTQFADADHTGHAREFFQDAPFASVLVTSELPSNPEQRAKSVAILEKGPVDHVIEFATVLRYLIRAVDLNSAYTASGSLQLLQLLKRYRLIQHQQMEFLFPMEPPTTTNPAVVETASPPEENPDKYEPDEWE